jgi:signal peptidase
MTIGLVFTIARVAATTVARIALVASVAVLLFVGVGPRFGSYRTLTVLTGSMRPTAAPGDLIVVRPVALDKLRVGDVITYQIPVDDHRVISHRIIEILDPGTHPTIRTQGDANDAADPWMATLNQGPAWRMSAVVPKAGNAIRFLRAPAMHTATTVGFPVLLAAFWLAAIWSRPRWVHLRPAGATN